MSIALLSSEPRYKRYKNSSASKTTIYWWLADFQRNYMATSPEVHVMDCRNEGITPEVRRVCENRYYEVNVGGRVYSNRNYSEC